MDLNELVIVATSHAFSDFAYISLTKEQLALEMRAHNREYPDQKLNTLNSNVESRHHNGHDISGRSPIPESLIPNYLHSSG